MDVEVVDFIGGADANPARAVAWYRDVLRLRVSEHLDSEVETPNVTVLRRPAFLPSGLSGPRSSQCAD